MDDPISFDKWTTRTEATVSMYVGFDVEFERDAGRAVWRAKGNTATASAGGATLVAVAYEPNPATSNVAAPETRHYAATKDGGRSPARRSQSFCDRTPGRRCPARAGDPT